MVNIVVNIGSGMFGNAVVCVIFVFGIRTRPHAVWGREGLGDKHNKIINARLGADFLGNSRHIALCQDWFLHLYIRCPSSVLSPLQLSDWLP